MKHLFKKLALAVLALSALIFFANDLPVTLKVAEYTVYLKISTLLAISAGVYLLSRAIMTFCLWIVSAVYRLFGGASYIQVPSFLMAANNNYLANSANSTYLTLQKLKKHNLDCDAFVNFHLLTALLDPSTEAKLHSLKQVVSCKTEDGIKLFAYRELAKISIAEGANQAALEYAGKILEKGEDAEILLIALEAANRSEKWYKIKDLLTDLEKTNRLLCPKVVQYYIILAKQELADGNVDTALRFLGYGLAHDPLNNTALALYCTINTNLRMPENNLKVLEAALVIEPSLELFILYHRSMPVDSSDQEIFEHFLSLIKVDHQNIETIIAISAYLGLPEHLERFINKFKQSHFDHSGPYLEHSKE